MAIEVPRRDRCSALDLLKPHDRRRSGEAALTEDRIMDLSRPMCRAGVAASPSRRSPSTAPAITYRPGFFAMALANRGLPLSDDGQFDAAEKVVELIASRPTVALSGDDHVLTGQAWYALVAPNSFNAGHLSWWKRRSPTRSGSRRAVLDADNPTIATPSRRRGEIQDGAWQTARGRGVALRQAVATYRKAYGGPHFLIGIDGVLSAADPIQSSDTASALGHTSTTPPSTAHYGVGYGKPHTQSRGPPDQPRQGAGQRRAQEGGQGGLRRRRRHLPSQTLGDDAGFTQSSAEVSSGAGSRWTKARCELGVLRATMIRTRHGFVALDQVAIHLR